MSNGKNKDMKRTKFPDLTKRCIVPQHKQISEYDPIVPTRLTTQYLVQDYLFKIHTRLN
jgi:hypothetical protein